MSPEERLEYLEQENKELRKQLAQRDALIEQLLQRVQSLEERLAKDSHNSSLPPSSDRFARQKKARSLRRPSGKKTGGQEGHPGATLEISQTPDEVIVLPPLPSVSTVRQIGLELGTAADRRCASAPLADQRISRRVKAVSPLSGIYQRFFPAGSASVGAIWTARGGNGRVSADSVTLALGPNL